MKKLSKWTLILFMLVTALFAVTACGSVEEIKIDRNGDQPQTVYVLGTELNREKGAIIASGEYESVPLSDPAVEISGYDKNTLGKQTLTITYMGASTTLSIEVVPRMQPKDFNYFVGEAFSAGKSQIKINNDDGSSKIIGTDDPDLKIEGFDSSKPATPLTVKATYQSEEMKNNNVAPYTSDVDVNIYPVSNGGGNGELHRPSKNAYESHELAVSVSGGYIKLESAEPKFERTVPVTAEMISGFDMSVATENNMETPATETLTVSYAAYKYTYDITIKFSDISLIKLRAKQLNERHDWSKGAPTVSEDDGKLAREMTDMFLNLSETRQAFVEQEEFVSLARYTAIYERKIWEDELSKYNFTVKANALVPSFENLDKAKEDLGKLTKEDGTTFDEENKLYKLAADISPILVAFYNFKFYNGQTIGAYLDKVCLPSDIQKAAAFIPHMETMYNALKDVNPGDSKEEGSNKFDYEELKAKQGDINAAFQAIYACYEQGVFNVQLPSDREYIKTVSRWKDDKDTYLRILYQYYLDTYLDDTAEDSVKSNAVQNLRTLPNFALPGKLEDYYIAYVSAYSLWSQIPNTKSPLLDNTSFYLYYDQAYDVVNGIDASDDQLLKEIYINLGLGANLLQMKMTSATSAGKIQSYGYVNLHDDYYTDETFDKLWDDYLGLVNKTLDDPDYGAGEEFSNGVKGLFEDFMNMTPLRQVSFLISIDAYYLDGNPEHLFNFNEIDTYFVKLIGDYYADRLPGNAFATFQALMLSIEDYSRLQLDDSGTFQGMYEENMQAAIELYNGLQGEEKSAFDTYMGDYYKDYLNIFNGVTYQDYGEWNEKIEELKELIDGANSIFNMIIQYMQQSYGQPDAVSPVALFPALASAFERADAFANEVLTTAPKYVVDKFKHEKVDLGFRDPETEDVVLVTLDYALYNARFGYMMFLREDLDPEQTHTTLMDNYFGWGFDELLSKGYTAILNQFYLQTKQDLSVDFNTDEIHEALKLYFDLTTEQKANYLMNFDGLELFANGVQTYYEDQQRRDMSRIAGRVFEVEADYILFKLDPTGKPENGNLTYQDSFIAHLGSLKSEYEKLNAEDKEEFDKWFKKPYDDYSSKEDEVKNYKSEG